MNKVLCALILIATSVFSSYAYKDYQLDPVLKKQIEEKLAMRRQEIAEEYKLIPKESLPGYEGSSKSFIKANTPEISKLAIKLETSQFKSNSFFANFNKKISIKQNWLLEEFANYASTAKKPLLDIGSGYGEVSLRALEKGAKVISGDISIDNLLIEVKSVTNPAWLDNLYLNTDYFPLQLNIPEQALGGVAAFRLLHFLSGHLIEEGVKKMTKWLGTGDKVFIMVLPPQNHLFTKQLASYERKLQEGVEWPGERIATQDVISLDGSNPPDYLHIIDEKPLRDVFEKYGFSVEKAAFIPGEYTQRGKTIIDEQAFFGMIAKKN